MNKILITLWLILGLMPAYANSTSSENYAHTQGFKTQAVREMTLKAAHLLGRLTPSKLQRMGLSKQG
jgi:hypothetical protein